MAYRSGRLPIFKKQPCVVIANPEQAASWQAVNPLILDLAPYMNDGPLGLSSRDFSDYFPVFKPQDNSGDLPDGIPAEGPVSDSAARKLIHGYHACVSSTDAAIGRLLDELKALDLEQSTIVILWGDHGWNLDEHGLWCKHCNFNTSLHTTLILKVPGKTSGRQTHALVEFIDIYPTLAELCNLALPDHLEGKSMVPLVKDPDALFQDFVLSKWYDGLTIKTRDYAYTEWFNRNDSLMGRMLYDHRTDRDENFNLAIQPAYDSLTDSLSRVMHANKGKDYYK